MRPIANAREYRTIPSDMPIDLLLKGCQWDDSTTPRTERPIRFSGKCAVMWPDGPRKLASFTFRCA